MGTPNLRKDLPPLLQCVRDYVFEQFLFRLLNGQDVRRYLPELTTILECLDRIQGSYGRDSRGADVVADEIVALRTLHDFCQGYELNRQRVCLQTEERENDAKRRNNHLA